MKTSKIAVLTAPVSHDLQSREMISVIIGFLTMAIIIIIAKSLSESWPKENALSALLLSMHIVWHLA